MMAQAAGDLGAVVSRMTWLEAVEMSREVAPEAFWRRRVMAPWTPVPEISPAKRVSSKEVIYRYLAFHARTQIIGNGLTVTANAPKMVG